MLNKTFHFNSIGVLTRGVPGPTSKLSLRVPAQMGRREMEHKGETIRGTTASCCPAPRVDALAHPPARSPSRTRALDHPFIDVRRRPRCTMGGVAMC
jgi:hypothetical protein